ncbi:MAG: PaaI family thioesterase [Desulfobulbaceae bacterium]|jgi:acyl-coenzyme A thioesterase PaaI-like protein|nr:PaaI family thioesterase [Desulfobulbaceae bacterium]
MKTQTAIQDRYPDRHANCFGCGRNNPHGLHLKSFVSGDEVVCRYTPPPACTGGVPDFLYGGLMACLFDCHSAATATAAVLVDDGEPPRFVTASLQVDFKKPTPMGVELELFAKAVEVGERKVIVEARLVAAGEIRATARVVMVRFAAKK